MKPPPLLPTSSAHTFPSFSAQSSSLNLSVAAASWNFSSLDSRRQCWLQLRFKLKSPVHLKPPTHCPSGFCLLYCTPPFPCLSIWFAFTPQRFSSSFLHLLCHSITLANRRLSLPPRLTLSLQTIPSAFTTSTASPPGLSFVTLRCV